MLNPKPCTLLILASLLAIPSIAAEDSPAAPKDLAVASDGASGVELQWQAPSDATPDAYRVYADGALATMTNKTSARVEWAVAYAVTAVYGNTESQPIYATGMLALPLLQNAQDSNEEDGCQNFPILIQPNTFPFLFVAFQEDCYNWLWDRLGFSPSEILSKVPGPLTLLPVHIQLHT